MSMGRGDWLRTMNATLAAEIGSAAEFAEAARGWFGGVLEEVLPDLYADLRARLVTGRVTTSARSPLGQPDQIRGVLLTAREVPLWRRSYYSERSWPRFLARLGEHPEYASIEITPLNGRGQPADCKRGHARVGVQRRPDRAPGWVCFSLGAPAVFTGWPDLPQLQDQWAGFVQRQAARIGACAGGMSDDGGVDEYETSLESCLPEHVRIAKDSSWGHVREELRGYWWVTVVPGELAARLGGPGGLAATGAFHEVSSLPDGSVWLRATPTINEFTGERIREVFEALAPILPAGVTKIRHFAAYCIVEGVDAADLR
jgi:hypothetical protein